MRKDRLDGQVADADEPRRQILRHSDHATGIRQIHPSSHSGRTRPRVLAAVLAMMLATIDHYTTQITELTAKIEALVAPYLHQVAQLDAVPGIGTVCAQDIIAEIGTDMTAFPTASHLVSWAKWSPQVKQSAGKRKGSNATGRGNPYLSAALGEAAISTGRTQSFLGAKYRRLTRRMPKKKALVAVGNSMLTSIHALLADPDASYTDLGADYYEQRMHVRRQARTSAMNRVMPALRVILIRLRAGAHPPDEANMTLGLQIGGETGVFFAKGTAEASVAVSMTWRRRAAGRVRPRSAPRRPGPPSCGLRRPIPRVQH